MNLGQQKVYQYILDNLAEGQLGVNERIPTEEELCRMFNTTRSNAHYALKRLEGHGILRRNKKQGTSIQKRPHSQSMQQTEKIARRGRAWTFEDDFSRHDAED